MASGSVNSSWTAKDNKMFEKALALYDRDTPDRWHKIERMPYAMGGKTADAVKRHYQLLSRTSCALRHAGQMAYANYFASNHKG